MQPPQPQDWIRIVFPFFFWGTAGLAFLIIVLVLIKGASILLSIDPRNGIKPIVEQLWCGKPGCL
jgi:hypothetical protein